MRIPPCVEIPAGRFRRGGSSEDKFANASELPQVECEIPEPFRMGAGPVTRREWQESGLPPNPTNGENPALPVVGITWHEAVAYCEWLTRETGDRWRLPTETEWEYACRAGTETPFHTGVMIDLSQANFLYGEDGSRIGKGAPVLAGSCPPNGFGLFDMHGNVSEWTADPWRPSYLEEAMADPERRVIRGGAWDYLPRLLRSSWRDCAAPGTRRDNLGFRVLCEIRDT